MAVVPTTQAARAALSLTIALVSPCVLAGSQCPRGETCPATTNEALAEGEALLQTRGQKTKQATIIDEVQESGVLKEDSLEAVAEDESASTQVALPAKCFEFFVTDCALEGFSASMKVTKTDLDEAFGECCKQGSHEIETCTALAVEVFDKHNGVPSDTMCLELVDLYETHKAWLQDKMSVRSASAAAMNELNGSEGSPSLLDRALQRKGGPSKSSSPTRRRRTRRRRFPLPTPWPTPYPTTYVPPSGGYDYGVGGGSYDYGPGNEDYGVGSGGLTGGGSSYGGSYDYGIGSGGSSGGSYDYGIGSGGSSYGSDYGTGSGGFTGGGSDYGMGSGGSSYGSDYGTGSGGFTGGGSDYGVGSGGSGGFTGGSSYGSDYGSGGFTGGGSDYGTGSGGSSGFTGGSSSYGSDYGGGSSGSFDYSSLIESDSNVTKESSNDTTDHGP